jgi:hypothetical protein
VTADFAVLVAEVRRLQDVLSGSAPPADVLGDATRRVAELSRMLGEYAVGEQDQLAGKRFEVPGRAQALAPVLHIEERDERSQRARVTFGRFYLGGGAAVHAGAIPLAFSELLGWLSMSAGRSPTRTAYLHVDYRSIAPIDAELQMAGWFEREEGRKRFLRGTLRAGERLCAEVDALYISIA